MTLYSVRRSLVLYMLVDEATVDDSNIIRNAQAISWPDDALETLRALHERTVLRVEAVVGKLPVAGGYPLGPVSRALLTTDVEEERKQREEDEVKRNPDKWRAVEGSDSDESEFEREPAPWDRPEYGGGQSGNPWESDREEEAPWDSRCACLTGVSLMVLLCDSRGVFVMLANTRPPWERRDSKEQGRGGGNPWDSVCALLLCVHELSISLSAGRGVGVGRTAAMGATRAGTLGKAGGGVK